MTPDDAEDEEPLVVRWRAPLILYAQLEVVGFTQIVPAIVRLDLDHSEIAGRWAAALELSPGAGAMVQLMTEADDSADPWGPCERLTPIVSQALDAEITPQETGGFLLGHDFLRHLWITTLGDSRLVVINRTPPGQQE